MPVEHGQLKDEPSPLEACPKCGARPFAPFMRGQVQRRKRALGFLWKQPYCAVFCRSCKKLVAWESPPGWLN